MEQGNELYQCHRDRLQRAVALQKPDRVPFFMHGDIFPMRYADPTAKPADLVERPKWANDRIIEGYQKLFGNELEFVGGTLSYPKLAGAMAWLSKTKLPGRELPADSLWQVHEDGTMKEEDYDFVIQHGWNKFMEECLFHRGIADPKDLMESGELEPEYANRYRALGIEPLTVFIGTPFESFCGARSMPKFFRDLHRMPDKVKAALDAAFVDMEQRFRSEIRQKKPFAAYIAGARAGSDFISEKMFERFFWPYKKRLVEIAVEEGTNVYLHMDSRWDGFLHYYRELPKGKCIFHSDGLTDIYKIKEILGDRMCIAGNVQPALLTLSEPDEVYKYCKSLLTDIGPTGFMMAVGCQIPPNAKAENMEALVAATLGK